MEQWIRETLSADRLGLAVLPAAFLFGILGSLGSCCALPVVGAVAGYAGASGDRAGRRELPLVGLSFLIGSVLSLSALGAVAGCIGRAAGSSLGNWWRVAAGLLMVFFGLVALDLLPGRSIRRRPDERAPSRTAIGALVYGLALGGGTSACSFTCNPLLPIAMGTAILHGATLLGAAMLAMFAVGYSLPLAAGLVGIGCALGRLSGAARGAIRVVRIAGAALLIAAGFHSLSGA